MLKLGRAHKKVTEKQADVLIEIDKLLGKEIKRKKAVFTEHA